MAGIDGRDGASAEADPTTHAGPWRHRYIARDPPAYLYVYPIGGHPKYCKGGALTASSTRSGEAWREQVGGIELYVRLKPRSSMDAIDGINLDHNGHQFITARVRALPVENAANQALEALISKWLGVAKSSVSVSAGSKSRLKSVTISGDPAELGARVKQRMAIYCKDPR